MPKHERSMVLHVDHHGPGPLEDLSSEQLCAIVHSDCDCYTLQERSQAWDIFRGRPDWDLVMVERLG
jgi:hypothetical protein